MSLFSVMAVWLITSAAISAAPFAIFKWWTRNPCRGAPAHIHLNGWPRLRRWLTDGPLPQLRPKTTCDHCGAEPLEPCDAGLHS